jgi:hypothetical protein
LFKKIMTFFLFALFTKILLLSKQSPSAANGNSCLSVHISRSGLPLYVPYIEAYIEAKRGSSSSNNYSDITIFLATHDEGVLDALVHHFQSVLDRSMIKIQQPEVMMRSRSNRAFSRSDSYQKHRLNSEVLTHIFLLSKCDFLIHGKYVVSEGALYINPSLHNHSVNVDFPPEQRKTPQEFAELVRQYYSHGS